ncbi:MAG: hypothetical protein PHH47_01180 [Gallionella sp.]|nr:hypothetical protein [Gallionella sp.]MDD4946150.1 hypothetical protein [Gallionella sp.]MDD5612836.1 hypothetical protein [Gallionella sp.]
MSGSEHKVAIAISSFRTNSSAMALVRKITAEKWPCEYILVVDSLGTGEFEAFIASNGLTGRVLYFNSSVNLGSAGNLSKRLLWGCELGMDHVLALNHDAEITLQIYKTMLDRVDAHPRTGALYPLRHLAGKGVYDFTGQKVFTLTAAGTVEKPSDEFVEMAWSSSNGALYAMEPLRGEQAICPDASLWMGWEDYLYGLQLKDRGYSQWVVTDAETVDSYEYKAVGFSPAGKTIADKPMWYGYYDARNMILIAMHRLKSPVLTVFVLFRVLLAMTLVPFKFKNDKWRATSYCLAGIWDGLRNVSGKWKLP